jgi:hypothetical protein
MHPRRRRWITFVVLAALTVVLGAAGWLTFPIVADPVREGSLTVQVATSRTVRAIEVKVTQADPDTGDGPYTLEILAIADGSNGDNGESNMAVTVLFPMVKTEQLVCLNEAPCVVGQEFNLATEDFISTRVESSAAWQPYKPDGPDGYESDIGEIVGASLSFQLDRPGRPIVNCTADMCAGNVPRLLVAPSTPVASDAFGQTVLEYPDLTKFTWSADVAAMNVVSSMRITSMLEVSNQIALDRRTALDGKRTGLDTENSIRTFVAGTLVALGGGTLVAIVTELLPVASGSSRDITTRLLKTPDRRRR